MTKCKGGCQMRAGGKTCKKCGCDMEDEEYEKGEKEEKEMRSGGSACMKCGGKMHKSGGTISSCMMCGGGKYTFGGKINWSKKKVTDTPSYSFGGVVKSLRKYGPGGEVKDETKKTKDKEIPSGKSSIEVSEPPFDINQMSGNKVITVTEEPTTEQKGYKEEIKKVESSKNVKKASDDYSLPNWGRAKHEQMKLNELIKADRAAGKTNMNLLAEDDVIGENTVAAMKAYEGNGYERPEIFKDKWLAQYAANVKAGIKIGGGDGKSANGGGNNKESWVGDEEYEPAGYDSEGFPIVRKKVKTNNENPSLSENTGGSGMFGDAKDYIQPGNASFLSNMQNPMRSLSEKSGIPLWDNLINTIKAGKEYNAKKESAFQKSNEEYSKIARDKMETTGSSVAPVLSGLSKVMEGAGNFMSDTLPKTIGSGLDSAIKNAKGAATIDYVKGIANQIMNVKKKEENKSLGLTDVIKKGADMAGDAYEYVGGKAKQGLGKLGEIQNENEIIETKKKVTAHNKELKSRASDEKLVSTLKNEITGIAKGTIEKGSNLLNSAKENTISYFKNKSLSSSEAPKDSKGTQYEFDDSSGTVRIKGSKTQDGVKYKPQLEKEIGKEETKKIYKKLLDQTYAEKSWRSLDGGKNDGVIKALDKRINQLENILR